MQMGEERYCYLNAWLSQSQPRVILLYSAVGVALRFAVCLVIVLLGTRVPQNTHKVFLRNKSESVKIGIFFFAYELNCVFVQYAL